MTVINHCFTEIISTNQEVPNNFMIKEMTSSEKNVAEASCRLLCSIFSCFLVQIFKVLFKVFNSSLRLILILCLIQMAE